MRVWCVGQVSELREEVSRLQAEKEELERELETQTNHTHKQVSNSSECEESEPVAHTQSGCDACRLQFHTSVCVFVCVQVSMLQSHVQTSEALLQDLQKSFSQSQNAVQGRLVSDTMLVLQNC